jgi:hypothetical protein
MGYKYLKIFIVSFFIFLLPVFSFALDEIGFSESDISVEITPENPKPYDSVTIKLNSYSTDLNKARIEWKSGAKIIASGVGRTSYTIDTFEINTSVVVDVFITPEGSMGSIAKRILIVPTVVDLLWESVDGYTPPFYKGKSLISRESLIKVVALPVIAQNMNTAQLTYQWKKDSQTKQNNSGFGRNYYLFTNDILKQKEEVSVSVSSVSGDYYSEGKIEIPTSEPKLIFYKKSPILGVLYNKALVNDSYFPEKEFTITAEPYFLAIKEKEPLFKNTWKVNSNLVPIQGREIILQPTATDGYATISVVMENFSTLFQKASGQLRISL